MVGTRPQMDAAETRHLINSTSFKPFEALMASGGRTIPSAFRRTRSDLTHLCRPSQNRAAVVYNDLNYPYRRVEPSKRSPRLAADSFQKANSRPSLHISVVTNGIQGRWW
jgi:hypothetical protein